MEQTLTYCKALPICFSSLHPIRGAFRCSSDTEGDMKLRFALVSVWKYRPISFLFGEAQ
jgi:hypothetical protein